MAKHDKIRRLLKRIYGPDGDQAYDRINQLMAAFPARKSQRNGFFSEADVVLITYGDSLNRPTEKPIKTLHQFAKAYLHGLFSAIHFLPFFPYSSDDGFSVVDFNAIDANLGTWEDVQAIHDDFDLMFDLVLNHISARSDWFARYLEGEAGFKDLAVEVDGACDTSSVVRPRALPLLTEFSKTDGSRVKVWTTFSDDQIDLNYKSIDVLVHMLKVLLSYVHQGADFLRLDAIAYLWKELGTTCIHLPQTHDVVKLMRAILDVVAPDVILITETNVPHQENISYFGDGTDEAQMVYNFTLPPLLLYTLVNGDATVLTQWAGGLKLPSETNTFFNFTASHDGIGVRPLEGILPPEELAKLVRVVKTNGGQVSYKHDTDGSKSPYELNIAYVDALLSEGRQDDPLHVNRFMASQAIQYSLPGVPATYIHSLLGSHNWEDGVRQTGRARTINREKLRVDEVQRELKDPGSLRSRIFEMYIDMIRIRTKQPAFHPKAGFGVLEIDPRVFAITRHGADQILYVLTNVTAQEIVVDLPESERLFLLEDLITGHRFNPEAIRLKPYQYVWLRSVAE